MSSKTPTEVLIFTEDGQFLKSDYPWATSIRITVQGGRGGASSNGAQGGYGQSTSAEYFFDVLPERLTVVIGKGGRGAPGAQDGEDGLVIVELYE